MDCYIKNKYLSAVYCFYYLPSETEMVLQIEILAEVENCLSDMLVGHRSHYTSRTFWIGPLQSAGGRKTPQLRVNADLFFDSASQFVFLRKRPHFNSRSSKSGSGTLAEV